MEPFTKKKNGGGAPSRNPSRGARPNQMTAFFLLSIRGGAVDASVCEVWKTPELVYKAMETKGRGDRLHGRHTRGSFTTQQMAGCPVI